MVYCVHGESRWLPAKAVFACYSTNYNPNNDDSMSRRAPSSSKRSIDSLSNKKSPLSPINPKKCAATSENYQIPIEGCQTMKAE